MCCANRDDRQCLEVFTAAIEAQNNIQHYLSTIHKVDVIDQVQQKVYKLSENFEPVAANGV